MLMRGMERRLRFSAECVSFGCISAVILSGLVSLETVRGAAFAVLSFFDRAPILFLPVLPLAAIGILLLAGFSLAGSFVLPLMLIAFGGSFGWAAACIARTSEMGPSTALLLASAAIPLLPSAILLGASVMRLSRMLRLVILKGGIFRPDFSGELLRSAISAVLILLSFMLSALCVRYGF